MKQKIACCLLCFAMIAMMMPAMLLPTAAENAIPYDTSWYTEHETEDVLYIEDAADLLGFSYLLSGEAECNQTLASVSDSQKKFLGKTIKLTADIDLNPGWDASAGTEPANIWLAGSYHSFSGMFDGQGHTISGVYLNRTGWGNYVGIFGNAKGGTAENPVGVKNLAIVNSYLSNSTTSGNNNLAAIFGCATWTDVNEHHNILIENVYVDAALVGIHQTNNTNGHIGGFIGSVSNESTVTIKNSVFAGSITATTDLRDFGGFIGFIGSGSNITLQNCAFTGSVKSGGNRVSGFIGEVLESATVLIEHCLEAGDVIPSWWASGAEWNSSFFGKTVGTNVTVRNSIYTDITNKDGSEVTHSPYPLNKDNKAPTMENLVYVPDAEMTAFGETARAALATAGMTDWIITENGLIIPKVLEEMVKNATKDQEPTPPPPTQTDEWKELFQKLTFTASSGATLNYRLYIPEDYDESASYPVVLFLHGADERGDDNEAQLTQGLPVLFADQDSPIYQCIVVAPQCPADQKWVNVEQWRDCKYSTESIPESEILKSTLELLDELKSSYRVDSSRIYATGLSMGGYGVWDLIVRHTDQFAAVIPICGGCDSSAAERLINVPIWTFHGLADTVVPPAGTADMVIKIRRASGTLIRYDALADQGHSIWDTAYATEGLLNWLLDQTLENRVPLPGNENEAPGPAESTEPTGEPSYSTDPPGTDSPPSNASTGCRSTAGTSLIPLLVLGCAIALWYSKKIIVTGFAKTQN